jgi:hypothetical protein
LIATAIDTIAAVQGLLVIEKEAFAWTAAPSSSRPLA